MFCDTLFLTEGTNDGYVYVLNVSGISFGHLARLSPPNVKKLFYYIQEAMPIRLKAIHVLNMSPIFEIIVNMVKPFLKKEIIDIVNILINK